VARQRGKPSPVPPTGALDKQHQVGLAIPAETSCGRVVASPARILASEVLGCQLLEANEATSQSIPRGCNHRPAEKVLPAALGGGQCCRLCALEVPKPLVQICCSVATQFPTRARHTRRCTAVWQKGFVLQWLLLVHLPGQGLVSSRKAVKYRWSMATRNSIAPSASQSLPLWGVSAAWCCKLM
jgi:hypothetical protein